MDTQQIDVMVADASHEVYVDTILDTIRKAAAVRGTGIAERTHEYVATKMKEGKAIIALCGETFAGFTYIESWGNKQYVATSGLIVHPDFRGLGLAKRIKQASFQLARLRWPKAKIFSLTSGAAVMKMNTELGYVPVTFNELTDDEAFWKGCEGCINHDILVAKNRKFCTGRISISNRYAAAQNDKCRQCTDHNCIYKDFEYSKESLLYRLSCIRTCMSNRTSTKSCFI